MPEVTAAFLGMMIERAAAGTADAVLPAGPSELPEPLCAAYHRRSLEAIAGALASGVRKVTASGSVIWMPKVSSTEMTIITPSKPIAPPRFGLPN